MRATRRGATLVEMSSILVYCQGGDVLNSVFMEAGVCPIHLITLVASVVTVQTMKPAWILNNEPGSRISATKPCALAASNAIGADKPLRYAYFCPKLMPRI